MTTKRSNLEQELRDSGASRKEGAELGRLAGELQALQSVKRDPKAAAETYRVITDRPLRRTGFRFSWWMATATVAAAVLIVPILFGIRAGQDPVSSVGEAFDRLTGKPEQAPVPSVTPSSAAVSGDSSDTVPEPPEPAAAVPEAAPVEQAPVSAPAVKHSGFEGSQWRFNQTRSHLERRLRRVDDRRTNLFFDWHR